MKPPPEFFHLRKELRNKQNDVRSLRQKWRVDHRDFVPLLEKVRRNRLPGTVTEDAPAELSDASENGTPDWLMGLMGRASVHETQSTVAPAHLHGDDGLAIRASGAGHMLASRGSTVAIGTSSTLQPIRDKALAAGGNRPSIAHAAFRRASKGSSAVSVRTMRNSVTAPALLLAGRGASHRIHSYGDE